MTQLSSPPSPVPPSDIPSALAGTAATPDASAHLEETGGDAETGRLVIVSNRVANLRSTGQAGGLAVGLAETLKERDGIWFGWNGAPDGVTGGEVQVERVGPAEQVTVPLSPKDVAGYYLGYANSVLWPLFHYRLDLVDYRPAFYESYQRVNETFARQLAPFLKDDDLIWVHDYHLIPLARCLRKAGCRQRIGFFLHIPFPPPDILVASPNHAELVEALLDYDVIGFQTQADAVNLKAYLAERSPAVQLDDTRFRVGTRTVTIDRFPIGIDAKGFAAMTREADDEVQIDLMRRQVLGRRQIIGVDRLDYSKGLPERLKAFDRLMAQHPELEKSVTYLQVAPPTREKVGAYGDIRAELEALVGAINGRLADFNWTPIRYIHRSVDRAKLAPLMRGSQVGFVTPLRDGMNLVAKEYVAAQDPADPGVLVLSRFAGAAEEMHEALLVNPYDIDEMARTLYQALTMPLAERRRRHEALLDHVMRHDARAWQEAFLAALSGATGSAARPQQAPS
ncbi:alpha,alpha-trehalose-phosphate synthase (UDP-forming) [Stappia indica]|uniref:Alpha,alpha-trehalose-phosphate synthase n=1 Tax=Stappia indica TaxID=538381 RepID=A0A857C6N2_9HYPH|nr:trehalose-6-phosphate synthase [Stappia indica]QGZ34630.1 alpha,alpha-trehalose-phosphate synthase [Stappia indica]